MQEYHGHNDFEEQRARDNARAFERMLRRDEFVFLDLQQIDEIFYYYLHTQEIGKAHELVSYALHAHPASAELYYKQARLHAEQGHYMQGVKAVEQALSFSPNHQTYLFYKSDLLARMDRYEEAIRILEAGIGEATYPEEVLLQMGNIAQVCRKPHMSESYYQKALILNPQFEEALFELAYLYESEERLEEVVRLFRTYLDQQPYAASVWHHLGMTYRKLGQSEYALEAFDFALVIQDDLTTAYFQKGALLLDMQQYLEALQAFLSASQYSPRDVHTLYRIAECFENLEMYRDAIRYYHKVTKLDVDYVDAWSGLGFCLERREQYLEAIHYYQKAFELESDSPDLCLSLAICEYKLGHYQTAYQYLERGLTLAPGETSLWQDWAQVLHENGNFLGAITYLEEAIKCNSEVPELYYHCAAYCFEVGQREKGYMYLENGLLIDFEAHYHLFHIDPTLHHDPDVKEMIAQYK